MFAAGGALVPKKDLKIFENEGIRVERYEKLKLQPSTESSR